MVATSNLSVPRDVGALQWQVFLADDTAPYATELVRLDDAQDLPSTLDLVHGPDTEYPVRIRVAALRDAESAEERVVREVEVDVPKSGERTVWLPLDWLCSDANLDSACREGETCRAGQCRKVATEPASEVPSAPSGDASSCFSVQRCFLASPFPIQPEFDRDTDSCQITEKNAFPGFEPREIRAFEEIPVNVGLIVDTWVAGSAGVCQADGKCVVALDNRPSEGWTTLHDANGKPTGIDLPSAVCKAIYDEGTLSGVAIEQATGDCPLKAAHLPVCESEAACVRSDGPCPDTWPSSWIGYSCSGAAKTETTNPDLVWCATPAEALDAAGPAALSAGTRQYCCTVGEPASSDDTLIDDMAGGSQVQFDPGEGRTPGFWNTFSQDSDSPITPRPDALFTYRDVSDDGAVTETGDPIENAACVSSDEGFSHWSAGMGFKFIAAIPPDWFDVSDYRGIEFYAWSKATTPVPGFSECGAAIKVEFLNVDTAGYVGDSTCHEFSEPNPCDDSFSVQALQLTPEWTRYEVDWCDLTQSRSEYAHQFDVFDPRVYAVNFTYASNGPKGTSEPFDYCVSQVRFLRKEAGAAPGLNCETDRALMEPPQPLCSASP